MPRKKPSKPRIKLAEPGFPKTSGEFHKYSTRREWLVGRGKTLGASEVPIVLGLLPWVSPLQLWSMLKGIIERQPENRAMRMGRNQERGVIKEYELETSTKVRWTPNILIERRVEKPIKDSHSFVFLHASPDAIAFNEDKNILIEAKCSAHHAGWAGDEPPLYVQAQVQAALWCLGWELADVVAYIGGRDLKIFRVEADEVAQKKILDKMATFVKSLAGDEPPWDLIDDSDTTRSALHELWKGRHEEGKIVKLPAFDDAPEKLANITAEEKKLKARENAIKNKIAAAIAEHRCDGIEAGGYRFSLEVRKREAHTVQASEFVQLNKRKVKPE